MLCLSESEGAAQERVVRNMEGERDEERERDSEGEREIERERMTEEGSTIWETLTEQNLKKKLTAVWAICSLRSHAGQYGWSHSHFVVQSNDGGHKLTAPFDSKSINRGYLPAFSWRRRKLAFHQKRDIFNLLIFVQVYSSIASQLVFSLSNALSWLVILKWLRCRLALMANWSQPGVRPQQHSHLPRVHRRPKVFDLVFSSNSFSRGPTMKLTFWPSCK